MFKLEYLRKTTAKLKTYNEKGVYDIDGNNTVCYR